ncbi:uncharacterized protein [Arachis hypogaea]|uniref:uncharacterized protein n=1 Tax=Arachis hypogaea TaxID=3818 RepID=UPI000DECE683|nr:uncharacterized protein LOC112742797 [Arachis hypogaea]
MMNLKCYCSRYCRKNAKRGNFVKKAKWWKEKVNIIEGKHINPRGQFIDRKNILDKGKMVRIDKEVEDISSSRKVTRASRHGCTAVIPLARAAVVLYCCRAAVTPHCRSSCSIAVVLFLLAPPVAPLLPRRQSLLLSVAAVAFPTLVLLRSLSIKLTRTKYRFLTVTELFPKPTSVLFRNPLFQGTFVEEIKEEVVLSPAHALSLIAAGEEHKHVGSTNFNLLSSRSHTIFTLGRREGSYINKSLLTLGTVISKLTEDKPSHIPYRDSKLTRLLQSSLSGHGRVSLICTVTPSLSSTEETHNTLKFAHRAKHIEIQAAQNKY